ncbi:hypothetical protein INR49_016343, partial [Caranx melampygus]
MNKKQQYQKIQRKTTVTETLWLTRRRSKCVTGILIAQMSKSQSATSELHNATYEVFTLGNITEQLQIENAELKKLLNSTFENCRLVEEERRNLSRLLNESLRIISSETAENKRLHQLLLSEQQTTVQLEVQNKKQRSILFSNHLAYLWRFCNRSTFECSRCLPGWSEHASRCFLLSSETEKWEDARRVCRKMGGDLAVVFDAEDQAFLTNMTYQAAQANPTVKLHSAWIGLQDMVKEGTHYWLNGDTVKWNVSYWKDLEPNNAIPVWDTDMAGQDCVGIVAPSRVGAKGWLNSWDDIVCAGKRHYLMKRALQANEQEDGGGTSGGGGGGGGGSQQTLKRTCKQRREKDLEEQGVHWECLPQEILLHIFQYLPLLDRAYASQ